MLAAIRQFAKSWLAIVLFVPLMIGFAIVGINSDILRGATSNYVVKAGSRTLSATDFRREFDQYRQNLEQRYQQAVSAELAVQQGVDTQMLNELALRESLSEILSRMGLRASDKMLKDELRKAPVFFDPVTGEFDQERYASQLAEKNLTPAMFETILSDEMRRNQFVAAASLGLRAPRAYSSLGGLYALEQRDLAYFAIDPKLVGQPPLPTDAEIQAFLKDNAQRLTLPEFRGFTVVRFSARDFENKVTVDPAEVQRQFDFQKDSLSTPETRTVAQIRVKDAAQGQAVAARLAAGEAPSVVAKSIGVEPVLYEDKPKSAFFDPAIAAAAFSTPDGQVSKPVKGQLGLVVLKVLHVTVGKTATLEEHRADIEKKVRGDLAGAKVSDISKVYEDAHEAGATLAEAARKAGAPVQVFAPVTADGRDQDGKPVAGLSPQVLKAVYELPQGGESDIMEAGEGEYFAVHVDRIVPPAMPPLAKIKPDLIKAMMQRRLAERLQKKAEELMARVKKGESIDAVAASVGARVVRVSGMSQATLQQHQALGRELALGAMGGKKGEPFIARMPQGGYTVGIVTAIRAGEPAQVAQATEQGRMQFTQELFGDIGESARAYAKARLKTRISPEKARAATGVDITQYPVAGAAPADKDKKK